MSDREPEKRRSTDPFSVFLTEATISAGETVDVALTPAGALLAMKVQRLLAQRATSAAERDLSTDIDVKSVAALLYLADGEEHRIDEVGARLEMTARRVWMAVHSLAENGLVEIANENREDEAVKLTTAGRALIVEISEIVASR
jgi:DNA-binding MarR family transcriptional regulator